MGKNQIIIYYLSVNYIKWFQQKKLIPAFFLIPGLISSPPIVRVVSLSCSLYSNNIGHQVVRICVQWSVFIHVKGEVEVFWDYQADFSALSDITYILPGSAKNSENDIWVW